MREDLRCLGLVVFGILVVAACVWLFGWAVLFWWAVYLVVFLVVGPEDRISFRQAMAILIGLPVAIGLLCLVVVGLRRAIGAALPALLPLWIWARESLSLGSLQGDG